MKRPKGGQTKQQCMTLTIGPLYRREAKQPTQPLSTLAHHTLKLALERQGGGGAGKDFYSRPPSAVEKLVDLIPAAIAWLV